MARTSRIENLQHLHVPSRIVRGLHEVCQIVSHQVKIVAPTKLQQWGWRLRPIYHRLVQATLRHVTRSHQVGQELRPPNTNTVQVRERCRDKLYVMLLAILINKDERLFVDRLAKLHLRILLPSKREVRAAGETPGRRGVAFLTLGLCEKGSSTAHVGPTYHQHHSCLESSAIGGERCCRRRHRVGCWLARESDCLDGPTVACLSMRLRKACLIYKEHW